MRAHTKYRHSKNNCNMADAAIHTVDNQVDTNRPVQSQKMARSLKFWIYVEQGLYMYYPSSENKGADLRLCFCIGKIPVFS